MAKYRHNYEVAEDVLRAGGSNEEIQRRVMEEFPNSRENPSRPNWYRLSWIKYGHCRGPGSKNAETATNQSDPRFITYENYRNPHVTIHGRLWSDR